MSKRRLIVISLDGLGPTDLPNLYALLPTTAKHLAQLTYSDLDCRPFVSAHPIWAELLTGRPWFENGCAGFSKPTASLQKLEAFTEDDLLSPVTLLSKVSDIVINIPLLQPSDGDRDFLSDGSTPSNKLVSPSSLLKNELFQQYRARPYSSAVSAISHPYDAFCKCIETERIRLRCAMSLFSGSRNWERFLFRLSIFDQLAHLFGTDVCKQTTLRGYDTFKSFMSELDESLSALFESQANVCFLSAFSHVAGRVRININRMLERGGFLQMDAANDPALDSEHDRRKQLTLAVSSIRFTAKVKSAPQRINTSSTRAASPVSGCIFINDTRRFSDGAVPLSEYDTTKEKVVEFLSNRLVEYTANATAVLNPSGANNNSIAPDLVVCADGVEFYNVMDPNLKDTDAPRAVHAPYGFAFLSKSLSGEAREVTPIELSAILRS